MPFTSLGSVFTVIKETVKPSRELHSAPDEWV